MRYFSYLTNRVVERCDNIDCVLVQCAVTFVNCVLVQCAVTFVNCVLVQCAGTFNCVLVQCAVTFVNCVLLEKDQDLTRYTESPIGLHCSANLHTGRSQFSVDGGTQKDTFFLHFLVFPPYLFTNAAQRSQFTVTMCSALELKRRL